MVIVVATTTMPGRVGNAYGPWPLAAATAVPCAGRPSAAGMAPAECRHLMACDPPAALARHHLHGEQQQRPAAGLERVEEQRNRPGDGGKSVLAPPASP
ncbi:hypothetical protein H6G65_17090 [Microcystis elabens FACHB-917]|nr:hypothetical protein [Microcystis elabens FACHB-917]